MWRSTGLSAVWRDTSWILTALQTTRANLAAKEAAFLEAATAKAALLSNSSLKNAPIVSSPTRH